MKLIFTFVWRAILGLLLLLLTYLLCAWLVPYCDNNYEESHSTYVMKVYIQKNGVHTDIIMPIKNELQDWTMVFHENIPSDTLLDYLAVGWGHRAFYMETPTWGDLTIKNALSATFGMGSTAVHVRNVTCPQEQREICRVLKVNATQYSALCRYIMHTAGAQDSAAVVINQLVSPHDRYYEANGNYNALRTCNTWVSDALIAAQQPGPYWTATTQGLFDDYK